MELTLVQGLIVSSIMGVVLMATALHKTKHICPTCKTDIIPSGPSSLGPFTYTCDKCGYKEWENPYGER